VSEASSRFIVILLKTQAGSRHCGVSSRPVIALVDYLFPLATVRQGADQRVWNAINGIGLRLAGR
jgi:hypothetical protein